MYVVAAQLIKTQRLVLGVLWTLVIATGLKGLEGTIRWFGSSHITSPPEQILGHEEALFMGLFILLTASLWLFRIKGRLRQVATALLPLVVFANLANNRRTAYVILGAGVAILIAVAWAREPRRRWMTGGIAVALMAAMALYLPVFWNRSGLMAQPANAIRSAVDPTKRDASSDLYRVIENANLGIDIRAETPLGTGFGKQIATPIHLVDISNIDPFIVYEPHNTILYIWLRLGFPGAIAFWWLIGAATIAACRLARFPDPLIALVGTFAVVAISAYLIEGWFDQGLVGLRIAIVLGAVLGTMEATRKLAAERLAS
jgi:O-antigen ligase